eukprot:TRINITY_DN92623_c0_g1_i1.p1 TRINITY_DN92623_c0_g1~~TRINITY_DN92623_c0_g1_i1.p1  ORF type:complete len:430 (-),score=57.69 TRINITY_DN92623_c0_g1_i1:163-1284(-)
MLGASNAALFETLHNHMFAQISEFAVADLLLTSWGASSHLAGSALLRCIQHELASRLHDSDPFEISLDAWRQVRQDVLGALWAASFAGCVHECFLKACRYAISRAGLALDAGPGLKVVLSAPSTAFVQTQVLVDTQSLPMQCEPQVALDLVDRAVLFKPPGWEVLDQTASHQLLQFVQVLRWGPITHDAQQQHGFLHRLDVPSSGLILVSKSYQAYYDLQVQLSSGGMLRDYVILSHGWIAPGREAVRASLCWSAGTQTDAAGQGKPSYTQLKVKAHVHHGIGALSSIAVRIGTGRTHQIRSHVAHIGHAVVCDSLYTSWVTFQSDIGLCDRNCLHRYRLVFLNANRRKCSAAVQIPADLVEVLAQLKGRSKA